MLRRVVSLMEGEWSCYSGTQLIEVAWSCSWLQVVSLIEREWSCYGGGHFKGRRMVMLHRWSL